MLREGPLHAALKAILAQPGDRLEVPVGRFVIDVVRADGELVEVQTGNFGPLGVKLDALLDRHRVRIVYPVAGDRRIVRVDERGEVLSMRRSSKHGTVLDVFDKLVAFPSLLTHPNLTIEVLLLGEDHMRAAARDDGAPADERSGRASAARACSVASSCAAPTMSCTRCRPFRPSTSARESWHRRWGATWCWLSEPPTA